MSSVFSKTREKRSRSSSNEANNSFVKNVTSRVSGLLPATITKWFSGNASSPNANGSAPTADATDSSTDDEAPERGEGVRPPLTKRMRFSEASSGNYNHYAPTENNCIPPTAEKIVLEPGTPYGTVQSPPGRNTFRRETNFVSTPFPNRSPEDSLDRTEKDSSIFKSQHSVSTIGPSVATKRKSLFGSPSNSEASIQACAKTASNTMRDPNQPCFKPSLLGSPFYAGRTVYGGASSSYVNSPNIKNRKTTVVNEASTSDNTISYSTRRIMDLLEDYSSPRNEARRIPQYTRSRNDSFDSSVSGPPSNKIVSYKTQELHVPSIATILRLKQRSRLMDTTNAARQIIASHSSTMDLAPYSVPNIANRQREQSESETSSNSSKYTTKLKTKLTRPNRTGHNEDTELAIPVVLPAATLNIDQNNLPKFTFNTVEPSTNFRASEKDATPRVEAKKQSTPSITLTDSNPPRKPETVTSSSYKFSSPVKLSSDEPQSTTTPPKFTFGSPERNVVKVSEKKDVSCVVGTKEPESSAKDWKCPDCWVSNKADVENCVCCGYAKPANNNKQLAKCSICKLADSQPNLDKCVKCEKVSVNNISVIKPVLKTNTSEWKCEDCWVSNKESAVKCACCGWANPKKSASAIEKPVTNATDSEWKCDDCWIKNKSNLDKCAACGGSKPNSKPQSAPVEQLSASNIFKSIVKTQTDKWECPSCLVRNDNDKSKCACCDAAKPGASNESQQTPAPAGLFSVPTATQDPFKNIVKTQTDKWECPSCLVRNDSDKSKCACCEADRPGVNKESEKKTFNFGVPNTSFKFGIDPNAQTKPAEVKPAENKEQETNNNVLPKTPSFSFGIPSKLDVQADKKKTEDKVDSAPKVNFSFGIPKSVAASTPAALAAPTAVSTPSPAPAAVPAPATAAPILPIFGIPKPPEPITTPDEEKPQEVPKVDFSLPKTQTPIKLSPNLFAPPLSSASTDKSASPFSQKNPTVTATFVMNSSGGLTEKKEAALPTVVSTTAAAPTPTFTFGTGSSLASTTSVSFGTPTTSVSFGTPAPTLNNTDSLFKKPDSTPAPALSTNLFAAPKTDAPSAVSLFQKTEAPTLPATTTSAPLFSFGNNAQSAPQPQAEKPKFNFTFGSTSKTESSPFKPAFGATTENKFTLPTGNTLGSGNALGGNGLSTGNGITINPISGSDATNPLTNNMQPSSGMFGAVAQKENMWSTTNNNNTSNNLFASNTTTSGMQKPAFSFGSSTPFNANTSQTASTPFNNNAPAPTFGTATPTNNVFGMNSTNNNSSPSLFGQANQPAVFGSPQASNPAPSLFGSPTVGATPTFGTPNQSIPSFETPSLTPAPAPAFNFGAVPSTGVFGFGGQQQQQAQQQQPNQGYNFGGAPAGPLQFNMGSQPSAPGARRMRRAIRRNTPR